MLVRFSVSPLYVCFRRFQSNFLVFECALWTLQLKFRFCIVPYAKSLVLNDLLFEISECIKVLPLSKTMCFIYWWLNVKGKDSCGMLLHWSAFLAFANVTNVLYWFLRRYESIFFFVFVARMALFEWNVAAVQSYCTLLTNGKFISRISLNIRGIRELLVVVHCSIFMPQNLYSTSPQGPYCLWNDCFVFLLGYFLSLCHTSRRW